MQYVYHMVPQDIVGDVLMPLNSLKDMHPSIYARAIEKYKGREFLLDQRVLPLNCLWNDVLHLAPIDPRKIYDVFNSLKYPMPEQLSVFKIPVSLLESHQTTIYIPPDQARPGLEKLQEDFSEFDPESYEEIQEVSAATKDYIIRVLEAGGRPLIFAKTPHILFQGHIPVKDLERLVWER